jgi:hypothetical protein
MESAVSLPRIAPNTIEFSPVEGEERKGVDEWVKL